MPLKPNQVSFAKKSSVEKYVLSDYCSFYAIISLSIWSSDTQYGNWIYGHTTEIHLRRDITILLACMLLQHNVPIISLVKYHVRLQRILLEIRMVLNGNAFQRQFIFCLCGKYGTQVCTCTMYCTFNSRYVNKNSVSF